MEKQNIYQDISIRTGGEIYLGVVGPVRSGKSTFIKRFMEMMVLPEILDENERKRTFDELPQSGTGKTIMTTEPKFIPKEAVELPMEDMKIKMDRKFQLDFSLQLWELMVVILVILEVIVLI